MIRGRFYRCFGKWIALAHYGFPFAIGHYSSSVGRFRALARRSRFAKHGMFIRISTGVAMMAMWPFGAFSDVVQNYVRMRGREDAPRGAYIPFDMFWQALRHSIPPIEYALYRLYAPEERKNLHEYVYWNDLPGLAALNERRGADNREVQDKDRFARICAEHGFPHAPTLAVFDRGAQVYPESQFTPDAPILWAKSLRLRQLTPNPKWVRNEQSYRDAAGRSIAAEKIAAEFSKQDCIVQAFIENHSDIADVSTGGLASLRVVTGMRLNGQAEFVTTLLSLPYGDWGTSIREIHCGIDRGTGKICRAMFSDGGETPRHPDTGVPIVGISLPYWRESVDLVLHAHAAAFSRFAFLGWDVALTNAGPLLLETNSGWGAIFHQMFDGPLGHTIFSELVAQHV